MKGKEILIWDEMMHLLTVYYGETEKTIQANDNELLGKLIAEAGLPLEQPCAGKGTCGLCKVLIDEGAPPADNIELKHLSSGEISLNTRLACRVRVNNDMKVILSPIEVYSNKIFRSSNRYKYDTVPLGLAIDLGSTTVAAYLTMLDCGEVCAGGAVLNQQSVYGADIISRLSAARNDPLAFDRLQKLALSSINQAVNSLKLSKRILNRIERATVVGNVAMHHLLVKMPIDTLVVKPFQPHSREPFYDATSLLGGIFPPNIRVQMPPLIGGFVGSDALACLAYFGFDNPSGPLAAIDLGTNGEVMVTDGKKILTASTAAGPAFEGVCISCGSRAVDGAIVDVRIEKDAFIFSTIGNEAPIGLTGSGLLSLVHQLRRNGVIEPSGRISPAPPSFVNRIEKNQHGSKQIMLSEDGNIRLTQWDIRELQKAKAAIRAAMDVLMMKLNLTPKDLHRVILTGSFGGQVNINAAIELGLIPPVSPNVVDTIANGAGMGAAMFLSDNGFVLGETLAERALQVDLEADATFVKRYIEAMSFVPDYKG